MTKNYQQIKFMPVHSFWLIKGANTYQQLGHPIVAMSTSHSEKQINEMLSEGWEIIEVITHIGALNLRSEEVPTSITGIVLMMGLPQGVTFLASQ